MIWDEIVIPKEIRHFMLEGAEETVLGKINGSKKQYRYGNLHIREYDENYQVHVDKVDPRKDPLGHLVHDAPEILAGVITGVMVGKNIASNLYKLQKNKPSAKSTSLFLGLVGSVISGYVGYSLVKKIKKL
jgi:hypothetical protein